MEVSQESLHITAVHLSREGSPSFSAWTYGRLHEAMQPWAGEPFSWHVQPVLTSVPRILQSSQVSLFSFNFFGGCSALKPSPLDTAMHALRPQTDVTLTLVLEFLCHEQLVSYEATVLLSDPLQHYFLHHS